MRVIVMLVALAATGCLKSTNFQCQENGQCGAGGVCEADGFCSVPADPSDNCASGRKYGENSGPSSGECVGGTTNGEAGSEPNMNEAGMEMPSGCPGSYQALPNSGSRGHRYRIASQARSYAMQRDACAGMGTFLAFPDGPEAAMELAALRTLAGDGAWVGVNDLTTEGTYQNSLNAAISAQTQALLNTGDGGDQNDDCLYIDNTSLNDATCSDSKAAVCECVP